MGKKRKSAPKMEMYSSSSEEEDPQEVEEEEPFEDVQEEERGGDGDGDGDGDSDDEEEEEEEEEELEEEEEDENGKGKVDEESKEAREEEDSDDEDKIQFIRNLLQRFGKEHLIDFITSTAIEDSSFYDRVCRKMDVDDMHRKIFVYGLGSDLTAETLKSAFKAYGSIEDCKVIMEKLTGKSKGYGFVIFAKRSGARKALKEQQKNIGGRMVSCQLASIGTASNRTTPPASRRIYVSGIGPGIDIARIKAFFESFGEIETAPPSCGRGFAVFTYKTVDGYRKALQEPVKVFEGCQLHCRNAAEAFQANQKPVAPALAPLPGILQSQNNASSTMGLNAGILGQQRLNSAIPAVAGQNYPIGMDRTVAAAALTPAAGVGLLPSVNHSGMTPALVGSFPGILPSNSCPPLNYASAMMGLNAGNLGQQGLSSMVPAIAGQNLFLGANASAAKTAAAGHGLSPSLSHSGMASPHGSVLSNLALGGQSVLGSRQQSGLDGLGLTAPSRSGSIGVNEQAGINSFSPSVIGNYDSQAVLQGLASYKSMPPGKPQEPAVRPQSGNGSYGGYHSSYFAS